MLLGPKLWGSWPQNNDKGFAVVIAERISVTGRIVGTERKNKRSGVDDGSTPLAGYAG